MLIAQVDTIKDALSGYEKFGSMFFLVIVLVALVYYLMKLTKEHKAERETATKEWQTMVQEQHKDMKELIQNNFEAINNNTNIVAKLQTLLESLDRRMRD